MTKAAIETRVETKSPSLGQQLEWETLGTEKHRVIVLLVIAVALTLFALIPPTLFSGRFETAFHGKLGAFVQWRFIVLGGLLAYLIAERLLIARLIKKQRKIPILYNYLTAFVETSTAAAATIVAALYADPASNVTQAPVSLYPIFIVLSALRLNFRISVFTGIVAGVEFLLVQKFFVDTGNDFWPINFSKGVSFVLLGVVTGFVAMQIKRRMIEALRIAADRNQIIHMFGEHVSPAVVDQLIAQGSELHSEKKSVCVMFLDIRNFTRFAEKRSPEEVVSFLESLFEFMIEIVNRHNGIINKFLGDGFMAVFGVPVSGGNDCLNAVNAAEEIIAKLNEQVSEGHLPPTRIGIGLHAGDAVTGSIGSTLRKEYTVIGDVVNLASRIEKLNKEFGSQLLISENVREAIVIGSSDHSIAKGRVEIRGREASIPIYQLA